MLSHVVHDTAWEAPVSGEDDSRDSELVEEVARPTMKHVDDNAIGSVLEEELSQRFKESGGVDHGTSGGHVCVGYGGVFSEEMNGDGKTQFLVAGD